MVLQEQDCADRINAYTVRDWQPLFALINKIETTSSFGEWPELVEKDGIAQLTQCQPAPIVSEFLGTVYSIPIAICFDWGDWDEGRKIASDHNFDFDTIDLVAKCKLITAIVRNDRFCEGALVSAFESGLILKILKSIEKTVNENAQQTSHRNRQTMNKNTMLETVNPFWGTRKLTTQREDHLTEFFAALLSSDSTFRQKYEEQVLSAYADKAGWGGCSIAKVETQVSYEGTNCCPDMRITLQNDQIVICEHKIEAVDTMGAEVDPRPQLTRYLGLPIDGLVYIRASWKPMDQSILSDSKYIGPSDRPRGHFLWSDFFPAMQASSSPLAHWMRDAFKRLGFTPAHPSIGDLSPSSPDYAAQRENFFKLVEPIRSYAHGLGWVPVKGTMADIWLQGSPQPAVHTIRIDITNNLLNIKIVPSGDGTLEMLQGRLDGVLAAESLNVECGMDSCLLPTGKSKSLLISVPVADVLANAHAVEEIQRALLAYTAKYIEAATRSDSR